MMTVDQMIQTYGKEKAVERMVHSPKNGRTGAEKDRGVKGWTRFRMCEHGNWVINDYKPQPCAQCIPEKTTKSRDFRPGFNIGLGAWVESRSEEKSLAKKMRLVEAG